MTIPENPIYVTQPSMPPMDEFVEYLKQIWDSKWLTNNGHFHQELEQQLCKYLGVNHISLFSNGTLALITALQSLRISGEVITTPFSFVATTHALHWNGITPVFVDIDPETFNINPNKIEAAITPKTTAILPVHVYGNPCNVEKIEEIARRYGLKILYDAAHAFGVKKNSNSILNYGDLSVLSFHATKVFTTIEGGAIVSHSAEEKNRIDQLKNFGFVNEVTIAAPGINAKMNEMQAAYGLLELKYVENKIKKRKTNSVLYKELLSNIDGITLMDVPQGIEHNYSYFPIIINESVTNRKRDEVYDYLKSKNIFTRRYFYPLISNLATYSSLKSSEISNLPIANKVASSILCLPMYPDLTTDNIEYIAKSIKEAL
ncbi:aminotransferase [Tenuifilaceae bacterium CYCD]|nr:aminotransferase [Tenuifilaceae bacterium CYCD]